MWSIISTNKKTAILAMLMALFGGFFVAKPALADTADAHQTVFSASINMSSATNGIGQSFKALASGTLSAISIPAYRYQNVGGVGALCSLTISVPLGVNNDFGSASQQVQSNAAPASLGDWVTFTWASGPSLIAGSSYWITLSCGNTTQFNNVRLYGSATDVYTDGAAGTSTNRGTTINPVSGVADLGFIVYLTSPVVTTNTIAFTTTPSTTPDFAAWNTRVAIVSTSMSDAINNWDRQILWGNSPTDMAAIDDLNGIGLINPFTFEPEAIASIPKAAQLNAGQTYFAQAVLCKIKVGSSQCLGANIAAQSDVWAFTISSANAVPTQDGNGGITAASSTNSSNFTCDTTSGFFSTSLCYLYQTLFQPQQSTLQQFATLYTQVQNKPPFGYVTIFANSINGLAAATSTTGTLSTTSTFAMAGMLSVVGQISFFSDVRNYALTSILWLAFVFYVYKRFKYFSMHG